MSDTKQAYVSPPSGMLEISMIRDANPRVILALDLGIPNFTVFSMTIPMVEDQPKAMSNLIAEAVNVLLDEVATFMMSVEYEQEIIVQMYATILSSFQSMSKESDSSKEQDRVGADPIVRMFEGTFKLPESFVNETQLKVVTAASANKAQRLRDRIHDLQNNPINEDADHSRESQTRLHDFWWEDIQKIFIEAKSLFTSNPSGSLFEEDQFRTTVVEAEWQDAKKWYDEAIKCLSAERTIGDAAFYERRFLAHLQAAIGTKINLEAESKGFQFRSAANNSKLRKLISKFTDFIDDSLRAQYQGHPSSKEERIALHTYEWPKIQALFQQAAAFLPEPKGLLFETAPDSEVTLQRRLQEAYKNYKAATDTAAQFPDMASMFTAKAADLMYAALLELIQLEEEEQPSVIASGAKKIKRMPPNRHIELTYEPKEKTTVNDAARVIRQYRNRSMSQQPRPLYVVVYDQSGRPQGTITLGPKFKNDLLRLTTKRASVEFTAPMSFPDEMALKTQMLPPGIPEMISVGGMTYMPEAVASQDMALYHGPQDYLVKFPDGRSAIFPGRPTFRNMRRLNFPVPRNRFKWTILPPQEQPKEEAQPEASINPTEATDATSSGSV